MIRSPGWAGVLSVPFPGLGHLYAGDYARGLALAAMFFAGMQSIFLDVEAIALAIPAIWIFGIVDAIRVAEEINRASVENREPRIGLNEKWAVALILFGAFFTLSAIPGLDWLARLWPIVLVLGGVFILRGGVFPWEKATTPEAPPPPAPDPAAGFVEPDPPAGPTGEPIPDPEPGPAPEAGPADNDGDSARKD